MVMGQSLGSRGQYSAHERGKPTDGLPAVCSFV